MGARRVEERGEGDRPIPEPWKSLEEVLVEPGDVEHRPRLGDGVDGPGVAGDVEALDVESGADTGLLGHR